MDRQALTMALLPDQEDQHLYHTNAFFHQAVDTLVLMLPHMVAALRETSIEENEKLEAAVARLRGGVGG